MNRRKFFAFLPAAPVAVATWPSEAALKEQAPPDNSVKLTLNGTMSSSGDCMHLSGGIVAFSYPKDDPNKSVSMAVGQDGNLWLKSKDGEWKRVVTE